MRRFAFAAITVALVWTTSARAQQADPQSGDAQAREASVHYGRGVQAYDDGDFVLALVEFERAQAVRPNYRILYNIGQVNQQLHRYARAGAALRRYLSEGGERIPAERRTEVERDLANVATKVARVRILVDVEGAEVLVDDVVIGIAPLADDQEIDAGEHRIGARAVGRVPETRVVTLAAGDATPIELQLAAPPPPQVITVQTPGAEKPPRTAMWISWGATGVLAAGSLFTGALALSASSDLKQLIAGVDNEADRTAASSRVTTFALTSDILAVSAVVAGGVALYLTLRKNPPAGAGKNAAFAGPGSFVFRGTF